MSDPDNEPAAVGEGREQQHESSAGRDSVERVG